MLSLILVFGVYSVSSRLGCDEHSSWSSLYLRRNIFGYLSDAAGATQLCCLDGARRRWTMCMMPDFDIDIRHPIVFGTRNNIQVHMKMHLFFDMPWSMVESAYSSIRMLVDPEHSLRKGLRIDIQGSRYHLLAIACWTHVHWPAFICFPHPAVHYAIFADFQHALRVAHLIGSEMDKFWKVAICNLLL